MAERNHLLAMLSRDDQSPLLGYDKPQAQKIVRSVWSCACQWCDILFECTHSWPGDEPEDREHWTQCSMFQCRWNIEMDGVCLFREGHVAAQTWF